MIYFRFLLIFFSFSQSGFSENILEINNSLKEVGNAPQLPCYSCQINSVKVAIEDRAKKGDSCSESLTCEDKILIAEISNSFGPNDNARDIFKKIEKAIKSLPPSRQYRLKKSFISLIKKIEHEKLSGNEKNLMKRDVERAVKLAPYVDAYYRSVQDYVGVINKMNGDTWGTYLLYAFSDSDAPLAKLVNHFKKIPTFEETPLGMAGDFLKRNRREVLNQMEKTFTTETKVERDKIMSELREVFSHHDNST